MADSAIQSTEQRTGHGCTAGADHDRKTPEIDLLTPVTFRGVTLVPPGPRFVRHAVTPQSTIRGMAPQRR